MAGVIDFKGRAKRIDAIDFGRIGRLIGVGEDEMRAVVEVEAEGGGFDEQGRPKMLFEPHIFYRELGEAKRARAVNSGLAYRKWGEKPYPKDGSYPRLAQAIQIDRPAALRSASWGGGQIMGFNHKLAGFASVDDMVEAFMADEEHHLRAMVEFIEANGLDDELRRHDWRGFARGYNGAGYERNGYHTKLEEAFEKWQRIPDAEKPKTVDACAFLGRTPIGKALGCAS